MTTPKLCGRCGAPVMAGAHACPYCGVSFEGAPASAPPAPTADPEIVRLLRADNKIEAIRRWRELTGHGLKQSLMAVEEIERQLKGR